MQEDRQDCEDRTFAPVAQSTSGITFLASNSTAAIASNNNNNNSTNKSTASGQDQPAVKRQRQTCMKRFVSRPMIVLLQSKIDHSLVTMIAKDFQPFSIVEDIGFREHTKALNPSYVLPSRPTISQHIIPQLFKKAKICLLEKIKAKPPTQQQVTCI